MNAPIRQPDEDLPLVQKARTGDRSAFNRLVLKYQDRVVGFCVRLEGGRQDGQDAAQEAFVKAYRSLDAYRGEARFSTWLYRIVVNTCRNRQRSWWRRVFRSSVSTDEPEEFSVSSPGTPFDDLARKRVSQRISEALRTLSPRSRELIVLRDIQGMSYEEISGVAGMALGTVKSGIARAREAMREQLRGIDET